MRVTVYYNVMFRVEVDVADEQTLGDAITDIEIPENSSEYVDDSFKIIEVFLDGKDLSDCMLFTPEEIQAEVEGD